MKWPTFPLSKLAIELQPGFAQQPDGEDGGLPHLRTNNVSEDGTIDLSTIKTIVSNREQRKKYSLQPFDILFNNTNSPALVGKTALFTEKGEFLFSNHMTRIRVQPNIANPSYIARYLHWVWETGGLRPMVTQWVSQAAINRTQLAKLHIPLPAPSEQRRIVEILDQADAIRRKRDEADIKAARILPALFCKMFGDPANWTREGSTKTLGELVEVISGATPSKLEDEYWQGNVPWVSPKDMKFDYIQDSIDHVSQKALQASNLKLIPVGALLIVVRGMILAHTVPVAIAGREVTINQDMKALIPSNNQISSVYLRGTLTALHSRLLSLIKTAGHGTRKLDTEDLLGLPILIPSVVRHNTYIRYQEMSERAFRGISETSVKLERLFFVLLHRAFSGDLTSRWRESHMKELLAEMEGQAKTLSEIC